MAQDNDRHTGAGTRGPDDALVHTHDLEHFKIPDGTPDPRGWDVRTSDGQKLGKVADLLVDAGTQQVRYLEIAVDGDAKKQGARDYYLVPIGTARLNDDQDDVVVSLTAADLVDVPVYERGTVSRDYEQSLRSHVRDRQGRTAQAGTASGTDFYTGPEYDDRSFFGNRRTAGTGARLADAVDDAKDRVDGNPASRPGPDATDRPGYGTAGAGTVGTGDRAAGAVERGVHRAENAADDLKDRVDGNPASRPGPDATDRPGRL